MSFSDDISIGIMPEIDIKDGSAFSLDGRDVGDSADVEISFEVVEKTEDGVMIQISTIVIDELRRMT